MTNAKSFLDTAYELSDAGKTLDYYREWAKTYDHELTANGYASPTRVAKAMAGAARDLSAAVLDVGCGTGLSGKALQDEGFTLIDGSDFSQDMLALAETKNIYRKLKVADLADPVPSEPGEYANITAVGVFSPGHAPADTIERIVSLLPTHGCFGFTLNDHALEDESYQRKIQELCNASTAEIAVEEYGPHLPQIELQATVYVLRKLGNSAG